MKKPQCEKPTAYNCGDACINVSKSCNQSPSDSFGRSRLQRLKQLASIYAKSNNPKNKKSQEATNRLINNITKKRKIEAGELSQARVEINSDRRKARLKAEARGKREQLLKLYEGLEGSSQKTAKISEKVLQEQKPDTAIKQSSIKYKNRVKKSIKNPQEAELISKNALKHFESASKEVEGFLNEARKLIEVDNPTPINFSVNSKTPQSHKAGVQALSRMISIPDLKDPVSIVDTPPERKGRSCYKTKTNKVFMGNKDPAVVVHEMSHWLEEKIPGIREEVQAFYEKRTQGEKSVKMSEVTGNKNYRDNEVTKVDKWINPYMGKEYKNASEILSMGMEMMYRNPLYLAKNDPEMFDFIYSVVRRK